MVANKQCHCEGIEGGTHHHQMRKRPHALAHELRMAGNTHDARLP
eukprot:CAMPEP_0173121404 /NCGR_PEP_ID=MMETSP1102-20130122/53280_1 /TAXON_ID=49646 /ORGANISM="Geminigera sp., Strain Caron Lab Isolate" /LENGTH=44 /DNA_ID= /DNA_START= /DNA_END= /DNA_ORIENTATION=